MKMKKMQSLEGAEDLNEEFNRLILGTKNGQKFLLERILKNAKWLYVMPIEYLEQLILNLEKDSPEDPVEKRAKNQLTILLAALVPVKKHLDEAWSDIDV